jgi:hypothetical protein
MKKLVRVALVAFLVIWAGHGIALAGHGNNGLYGPHWQFNLIGHPKGISGDDGNGRAIMVPLGVKKINKNSNFTCTLNGDEQFGYVEDAPGDNAMVDSYVLKGVKLVFEKTSELEFDIIDRDATDGEARILVPETTGQDVVDGVDVFIRILGKPYACMQIDGVAYDQDQATSGVWYYSGHVTLNRKPGKSAFENINDLFDVYYCDSWVWDDMVQDWVCTDDDIEEISVFSNVFEQYFWDIQNYGTRIVQVRLYPRTYQ